jgi:hypothetical protein
LIHAALAHLHCDFEGIAQPLRTLSALPPKAEIAQHGGSVRIVPEADKVHCSKKRFVGGSEQYVGYREPERICGLEVDNSLNLV